MEEIFFQIISQVGMARTNYIEAIHCAKCGDFEGARNMIKEGREYFIKGHQIHAELISKEAVGEPVETGMFLMHAEDQLMSAEMFSILADEFISVYKSMEDRERSRK